jgi:parallel beta-helix repeat protein
MQLQLQLQYPAFTAFFRVIRVKRSCRPLTDEGVAADMTRMRRCLLGLLFGCAVELGAQAPTILPRAGMVITRSTKLRPGTYRLTADTSLGGAVIRVRGSGIVLDLTGVELVGSPAGSDPDRGQGVAIMIDSGANVTVRNGKIRGYKIAIRATAVRNLRLLDNDLSHNWKPRLFSIVEHESLADWLSFHQNEKDEWLRFGAAIYLTDVRGGEVRGNTARQGMNGLLMTRTDSLLVWNNDLSFNSGLGIGMYRSDHNRIMHNTVEYNVRGYSEGFYRRGQDSAGILIYQQSDSNVVAFNSVTHGGDGLFLWAGQHTMDTGQGGANDNLFYNNDFSWAPTNGMEATFSRNAFVGNRIVGSDHGLWGGYSFNSLVLGNTFSRNRVGIAIEHGQENSIVSNRFIGDSTAIYLWANKIEPSDWGYPKHRDTRSRGYSINSNTVSGSRVALRIGDTHESRVTFNNIIADTLVTVRGDTSAFRLGEQVSRPDMDVAVPVPDSLKRSPLPGGKRVLPGAYADWPRSTIIVDDWGPYDWTTHKLWPADSSLSTPLRLRVLGPRNGVRWTLSSARGATVSKRSGVVGDTILVTPASGAIEDWTITLNADRREPRASTSRAESFSYSRFDPRARWTVTVYAWTDSATNPMTSNAAFGELLRGERGAPAFTQTTNRLDYVWYRPRIQGWPQDRAGVRATTEVDLPPGNHAIRTISDDGIRVYVDDQLVIEDWSIHESKVHEAPLSPGRHRLRIEYFQRDGWTELQAHIIKR